MSDRAVVFHDRHRKRLGICWRCLRRYPCGVIRAFEHGYVVGWDGAAALAALSADTPPSPSANRPPDEPTTPTGTRLMYHGLPDDHQTADLIIALDDIYNVQSVGDLDLFIKQVRQEAAAAERRRLLEVHMADHDDATGWCPTCALLTEDER